MFLMLLRGLQNIQYNYPVLNRLFNKFVKILFPHTLNQKLPPEIYGNIISFLDNGDDIASLSFVESSACCAFFKYGRKQIKQLGFTKPSEETVEYYGNVNLYLNLERTMYAILDPLFYCGCSYLIYVSLLGLFNDTVMRKAIFILNFNSMMCYIWPCEKRKKFSSQMYELKQFNCKKESWLDVLHSRQLFEIFNSIIPKWMAELAQKFSPENPSNYRMAQIAEFLLWNLAYLVSPFGSKFIPYCLESFSSMTTNIPIMEDKITNENYSVLDVHFPIMYLAAFICKIMSNRINPMILPAFIFTTFIYTLIQVHI